MVEAGLKRWEIGEIASRIGQLYFGQYMRTSEANFLTESYIFYEAILAREYFKDGLHQDVSLASKQLRFLARFLTVCLVLNRREMVYQLVNQLKMLLDECKRTFQVIFPIYNFYVNICLCDIALVPIYGVELNHTCNDISLCNAYYISIYESHAFLIFQPCIMGNGSPLSLFF